MCASEMQTVNCGFAAAGSMVLNNHCITYVFVHFRRYDYHGVFGLKQGLQSIAVLPHVPLWLLHETVADY